MLELVVDLVADLAILVHLFDYLFLLVEQDLAGQSGVNGADDEF